MNEIKNIWQESRQMTRVRGRFLGLVLALAGGYWLASNTGWAAEPSRIVLPGLLIALGVAKLIAGRRNG